MSKTSTNQDIINHIYKELEESTESQIFNTNTNENLEISLYKEEVEAILDKVGSIELIPSKGVMDRILNYSISKKICN
ncbi:MAG: hypothetical protein CMB88_01795 [Flammeovirgaceae bacterium]|mgnify:FL=1|nr:hypothetical protein [Flammeovirgaceae bacterium]|tara:strand:- start:533 stop:766 length:234 start_codon:yes stop_codon:yes gene_type:complete